MILSTSAIKNAFIYIPITLFTLLFGAIYEIFSHGVYSYFMIYAFAFPLVGGLCFWLAVAKSKKQTALSGIFTDLHAASIATWTLGFIVRGALDIYGTTSKWCSIYWVLGAIVTVGAVTAFIIELKK